MEETVEKAIDKFFIKLQKPKEAITEFKFNNNVIDIKSKQKLSELGLTNNSKILSVKADNYDALKL